jgi:oxidase EvaA
VLQPEIGILGVITRMIGGVRHFLLPAKNEPGNLNGLQLAPTEDFVRHGYFNIEARNLLPCLDISGAEPLEGEPV